MTFRPLPERSPRLLRAQHDADQVIIDVEQVRRAVGITDLAGMIDLDSDATGGNTSLTGTFQTALTHAYTPPTGWGTYKVQAQIWASGAGFTSGDQFQIVVQITGGGAVTGTIVTDDAAATSRSSIALVELANISGAIDVLTRVRNNTAARGTVYVVTSRLIAVRQT